MSTKRASDESERPEEPCFEARSPAAREAARRRLHLTGPWRQLHDHRLDAVTDGRPLRRLPDRTQVRADEHDEALARYEAERRRAGASEEEA